MKTVTLVVAMLAACAAACADTPPNVVLILCDNLGYGDVGCYGSTLHRTPHIDRMAAEGMRFTDAYAASGVCTPSRAALMTGCYPRRVNLHVSDTGGLVLQPVSPKGLNPDETTIAEVLKTSGYTTSIFGKWHLGDQPEFLPTRQGFDKYFGIPYSDDMTPRDGKPWPPLPLMKDEQVVEAPADRNTLTKRYTEAAVKFMTTHRDEPFFIYLAHAMPGSTRASFASDAFRGRSENGLWGDAVEEIDWSTGQILDALHDLDLDENTLVIWTNDNGAPRRNPPQGSNAPLKGWGYDVSEGAMRVPLIARWPGIVPAGSTCRELVTLMDLYPTLATLAGSNEPSAEIDGRDIGPLLTGREDAQSPHQAFFFYRRDTLKAVRSGPWKLYLPEDESSPPRLYNLVDDLAETRDLAASQDEVVARLTGYAGTAREELGDGELAGTGQRPAGFVPEPTALRMKTERPQ